MNYQIKYSCVSHIGNVRSVNQDNFICDGRYLKVDSDNIEFPLQGHVKADTPSVFGIFDGMGGEECGEVASCIASTEASVMKKTKNPVSDLLEYCRITNEKICEYTNENHLSAMGTTAAMLLFGKKEITLCNIGDSKVFRYSNGILEQISKDHVVMTVFGKKPPLSQNLGIPSSDLILEPYISQGKYKNGDGYLICSDGLTDMLSKAEIEEILNNKREKDVTEMLLNQALQRGGKDNITIIWLEVNEAKYNIFKRFTKDRGEVKR